MTYLTNKPLAEVLDTNELTCKVQMMPISSYISCELPPHMIVDLLPNSNALIQDLNKRRVNFMQAPIELHSGNVIYAVVPPKSDAIMRITIL